jgi:hypothetical protein
MNKKFILLMLCGALISCGSSSIAPANPYNDDMFDDQPMTVKVSVDPSGLNCSVHGYFSPSPEIGGLAIPHPIH